MPMLSGLSPDESAGPGTPGKAARIPILRVAILYLLWLAMAGTGTPELIVGILAAGLAAWVSVKLDPAGGGRWRPLWVSRLCLRFLRDSVVAGAEVALIALRPEMRLKPGVIEFPSRLPPGGPRAFFNSYSSLMPGTLAVEPAENGNPQFHCLDTGKPVVEEMKAHEELLARGIGEEGGRHG